MLTSLDIGWFWPLLSALLPIAAIVVGCKKKMTTARDVREDEWEKAYAAFLKRDDLTQSDMMSYAKFRRQKREEDEERQKEWAEQGRNRQKKLARSRGEVAPPKGWAQEGRKRQEALAKKQGEVANKNGQPKGWAQEGRKRQEALAKKQQGVNAANKVANSNIPQPESSGGDTTTQGDQTTGTQADTKMESKKSEKDSRKSETEVKSQVGHEMSGTGN